MPDVVYVEDSRVAEPHMYCVTVDATMTNPMLLKAVYHVWDGKHFDAGREVAITPRIEELVGHVFDKREQRMERWCGHSD